MKTYRADRLRGMEFFKGLSCLSIPSCALHLRKPSVSTPTLSLPKEGFTLVGVVLLPFVKILLPDGSTMTFKIMVGCKCTCARNTVKKIKHLMSELNCVFVSSGSGSPSHPVHRVFAWRG